jgi:hypothetical protein
MRSRSYPPAGDALSRSWRELERRLRHAAEPRAPYESTSDYAERVGRVRPELASTVRALARRYARLRYGAAAGAAELEQFRRAVRGLRADYRAGSTSRTRASSNAPPMKNRPSTRIDKR